MQTSQWHECRIQSAWGLTCGYKFWGNFPLPLPRGTLEKGTFHHGLPLCGRLLLIDGGLGLGVPAMRGVLVCQGCSNKVPQTGWLITKRIVFFHRNSRQKSAFHLPHAFCFLFWASVGLFLLHQLSNAPQKRDPSHSIISIRDTVAGFIHSCLWPHSSTLAGPLF